MNIKETDLENVKKIGVYCITNLVNGKKYIGKTGRKEGFIKRWNNHKNNSHSNYTIYRAFNKYGINNFEFSILEIIEPMEDIYKLNNILNFWERYWIKYYDTYNNGYNMTKDGEGILGYITSEETKQKLSKIKKQYYIDNPDKKPIGEKNPMFGKFNNLNPNFNNKWSKEQKEKMSLKIKLQYKNGKKPWSKGLTKYTDERLRIKAEKQSKLQREQYNSGKRINPHKGRNKKEFEYLRIAGEKCSKTKKENGVAKGKNNPRAKAIVQLTLDGQLVREYEYIGQVEEYGFSRTNISDCINHKNFTILGDNIYGKMSNEKFIWLSKKEYFENKG